MTHAGERCLVCDIIVAVRRRNPVQVRSGPATVTLISSRKSGRLSLPAVEGIGDRTLQQRAWIPAGRVR
jgi:hypothetical protein